MVLVIRAFLRLDPLGFDQRSIRCVRSPGRAASRAAPEAPAPNAICCRARFECFEPFDFSSRLGNGPVKGSNSERQTDTHGQNLLVLRVENTSANRQCFARAQLNPAT